MATKVDSSNSEKIAKLEQQIQSLLAEKGIPADPVEAAFKNVRDHLDVLTAMHPGHDFTPLIERHEKLKEAPSPDTSAAFVHAVHTFKPAWQDMAYIRDLTNDLHQVILDNPTSASPESDSDED